MPGKMLGLCPALALENVKLENWRKSEITWGVESRLLLCSAVGV